MLPGALSRLDWMIAWRHLRAGEKTPVWVWLLLGVGLYLMVSGFGLAGYAQFLDSLRGDDVLDDYAFDMGPPRDGLAAYYRSFGFATVLAGALVFVLAALARFFSVLPTIIAMSVLLGTMALVTVLSLFSGLEDYTREKIIGQRAHIRISAQDGGLFGDYEALAQQISQAPLVVGVSPYLEGEIMVLSPFNRQGAILTGILPQLHATASDLPDLVRFGAYRYLDAPQDIPVPDPFSIDLPLLRPPTLRVQETQPIDVPQPVGADSEGDDTPPLDLELVDDLETANSKLPTTTSAPRPASSLLRDLGRLGVADLPPPPSDDDFETHDGWEDPAQQLGWERPSEPSSQAEVAAPEADVAPGSSTLNDAGKRAWEGDDVPVLIGKELAEELSSDVGAQLQLITSLGRMTPAGWVPGVRSAKVAGVFESGMYEFDRKNVYAPLAMVQKFLRAGERVSGIEVKLVDIDEVDAGKGQVRDMVAAAGLADTLIVEDWRDLNRNLFSAMFLEKVAIFIGLMAIILVASFGILASNLMSVMEKSKEIAILKAMGSGDAGILRIFVAEGLCVGLLGCASGIALGLGLCWIFARYGLPGGESFGFADQLPVAVDLGEVALVGGAVLVVVWLSSLYPAWVASRLRPVEALRQADR